MLGIDVTNSRELRATFLGIRNASAEVSKQIRTNLKSITTPEWQATVSDKASTAMQTRVLAQTARVSVSNQNVRMSAGNSAKRLSGGARVSELAAPEEFGSLRNRRTTYTQRSKRGRPYTVHNRHTTRQFKLTRSRGYVAFPAATVLIPRIAALVVQTTIRTLLDAVDGKAK